MIMRRKVKKAARFGKRVAFLSLVAIFAATGAADAGSTPPQRKTLPQDARFCPSWAEAHERTLASLNNGRPPYPVRWKGCIWLKKGTSVEILDHDDQWTEILFNGK